MRVLHLTLKKKWFDMIASGEKKEEYRELKPYWRKRLLPILDEGDKLIYRPSKFFDVVRFVNGGHFHPSLPALDIEFKQVVVSTGREEWGAEPGKEYFVIKLGDIISQPITTPASDAISVTNTEDYEK